MKKFLLLIWAALAICPSLPAKDRAWLPATVTGISNRPARVMDHAAGNEYTIRTEKADYVLEHAAGTYYTSAPKEILSIGDTVQFALDCIKHAYVKTGSLEKRLRIVKVTRR